MGLTMSTNNNTESSEKYKILDNQLEQTDTNMNKYMDTDININNNKLHSSSTHNNNTVNNIIINNDTMNNTINSEITSKQNLFQCPNQHINCKNQRCWW